MIPCQGVCYHTLAREYRQEAHCQLQGFLRESEFSMAQEVCPGGCLYLWVQLGHLHPPFLGDSTKCPGPPSVAHGFIMLLVEMTGTKAYILPHKKNFRSEKANQQARQQSLMRWHTSPKSLMEFLIHTQSGVDVGMGCASCWLSCPGTIVLFLYQTEDILGEIHPQRFCYPALSPWRDSP